MNRLTHGSRARPLVRLQVTAQARQGGAAHPAEQQESTLDEFRARGMKGCRIPDLSIVVLKKGVPPTEWGDTALDALCECIQAIDPFPYEGQTS